MMTKMSDETGLVNDRERYRRDADGQLTVWGARDVLATLVHQVATEVASLGPDRVDDVLAATARRVERALDDLEDACYDRPETDRGQTADQDDQTSAGVTIPGYTGSPVGARSLTLDGPLVLREGDVVNMSLRTNASGELVIGELEVIRGGSRDGDA